MPRVLRYLLAERRLSRAERLMGYGFPAGSAEYAEYERRLCAWADALARLPSWAQCVRAREEG